MSTARCCISALYLRHNFLDESHEISQEIDTIDGSYWHGIMHRREPDYDNAKYWFRRVPSHPVFGPLCEKARELAAKDNVSVDQFIALALAEKISALMTEDYLAQHAARGDRERYREALSRVPDVDPDENDRL